MTNHTFHSPQEVADILNLSRAVVCRLIRQGRLKAIDISSTPTRKQLRVSGAEIIRFSRGGQARGICKAHADQLKHRITGRRPKNFYPELTEQLGRSAG